MAKPYHDLGTEPSPVCSKGRHDRCAAYDTMVVRCTCGCHGKADSPEADWMHLLDARRRGLELRPPAGEDDLKSARRQLGRDLPRSLVSFYRQTNGFFDTAGQWEPAWSLARLVSENDAQRRAMELPLDLLAFGDDGAGDWFCVWADEHEQTVFHFSWIDLQATPVAADLRAFWPGWLDGTVRI